MNHEHDDVHEEDHARHDAGPQVAPAGTPNDPVPVRAKRVFAAGINAYPPYRSKIDDLLRDEHRAEYEKLLVRGASIPKLRAWLHDHGYDFGRCTVERHRMKFQHATQTVQNGALAAEQFARVARSLGLTLGDAWIGGFHQVLMEFFARHQLAETLEGKDVQAIATGLARLVELLHKLEDLRGQVASPPAGGADPAAVVDRVRAILGA